MMGVTKLLVHQLRRAYDEQLTVSWRVHHWADCKCRNMPVLYIGSVLPAYDLRRLVWQLRRWWHRLLDFSVSLLYLVGSSIMSGFSDTDERKYLGRRQHLVSWVAVGEQWTLFWRILFLFCFRICFVFPFLLLRVCRHEPLETDRF